MFKNLFSNLTPITKNIIIINVVVFVVSSLLQMQQIINLDYYLAAFYPFSPNFKSWQILTHMFMHGGIMHIAFNMLTLASFGPLLERFLGEKKFILLYFLSGIGSFLLFNIWNYYEITQLAKPIIDGGYNLAEIYNKANFKYQGNLSVGLPNNLQKNAQEIFNALQTPMLGASGAIFGVIAAFAILYPDAEMLIMFIPFPIKAKVLLPIVIIVSLYLGFSGNGGNIAHFAHIGGALVGVVLIKIWGRNRYRIN